VEDDGSTGDRFVGGSCYHDGPRDNLQGRSGR